MGVEIRTARVCHHCSNFLTISQIYSQIMKILLVLLFQMVVYGIAHQATTADPCPPITDDCCGDLGVCPNRFCCPDWYCAAIPADCAFESKRHQLLSWVRGPLGWTAAE